MLRLPLADQALLEELGYKKKLQDVDKAILVNATFLNQIVANPEIFGHDLSLNENEENIVNAGDSGVLDHSHDCQGPPFTFHSGLRVLISNMAGPSHTHSHSHAHSHTHDVPHPDDHRPVLRAYNASPKAQKRYQPTDYDMDKLRSTIKQFVRDWSEEVP